MLKLSRLGKEVFTMNHNQEGPYHHYERPQESRVRTYKSVSKGWLALIVLLVVVLVALVPVVHHLAGNNNSASKVVEVRKTSKKTIKHTKAKNLPAKNKKVINKSKAKTKTETKSKKKPQTKPQKKRAVVKQYVVKSGDSLTSIANRFNMSVGYLAQLNQLDPYSQVDIGQTLKIRQ